MLGIAAHSRLRVHRKTPATACLIALALVFPGCKFAPKAGSSSGRVRGPVEHVLRVAINEPDSLDPTKASNRPATFVVKQICDTLVGAEPGSGALKHAIAETWSVSPDAKKVTFQLRPDVKFHNGREVTAQDFVWSMSRFVNPKSGSPQYFLMDKIAGYSDVRSGKTETLSGVSAPDPHTLEVSLSEPYAEFPAILANPSAGAALPKEEVLKSPDAFGSRPICSGPYQLDEPWSKGQDIHLSKFVGYYGRNDAFLRGGLPGVDKILLRSVPDDAAGYRLLEQGELDIAAVPLNRVPEVRKIRGRLVESATGYVAYLGFPTTRPPYDNPNLRKALSGAIDRKKVIAQVFAGGRQAPGGFLPPSAGPASSRDACEGGAPSGDSSAAKQALNASGIAPSATKPVVYFNSGAGHEKWLAVIVEQWKTNLGIEASLKPADWTSYLGFLVQPGADGPFRLAWSVAFPSPEALYQPLFATGSLDNFTRFSNPQFDDLLKKARMTVDDAARRDIYLQAGRLLCEMAPIAPLWFGTAQMAFGPEVALSRGEKHRLDAFGDPIIRELSSSQLK